MKSFLFAFLLLSRTNAINVLYTRVLKAEREVYVVLKKKNITRKIGVSSFEMKNKIQIPSF
jgi:hypothetical protein